MITDWIGLAKKVGSLNEDGRGESGGDHYAERALDEILGDDWIAAAVEHAISFKPGKELAMNCLSYIRSLKAAQYAYQVYKSSEGERAEEAVWLIKHISHPAALAWIEEFLNDNRVTGIGLGVLDQLLWKNQIPYDSTVESLLTIAYDNSQGRLAETINFIRDYACKT